MHRVYRPNQQCLREHQPLHHPLAQRLKAMNSTHTRPLARLFCELSALKPSLPTMNRKGNPIGGSTRCLPGEGIKQRPHHPEMLWASWLGHFLHCLRPCVALPSLSWFLSDRSKCSEHHSPQPTVHKEVRWHGDRVLYSESEADLRQGHCH